MKKYRTIIFSGLKIFFIIIGVIAFLRLSFALYDEIYYSKLQVPENVKTIYEFKNWHPDFNRTSMAEINNSKYYIITGDFARSWPSAKCEYYFDSNGNYMGWNVDPGDFMVFPFIQKAKKTVVDIEEIGKSNQKPSGNPAPPSS